MLQLSAVRVAPLVSQGSRFCSTRALLWSVWTRHLRCSRAVCVLVSRARTASIWVDACTEPCAVPALLVVASVGWVPRAQGVAPDGYTLALHRLHGILGPIGCHHVLMVQPATGVGTAC